MLKLRPETDLNDTIISDYLKLFELVFLPTDHNKIHFYSSYLVEKLITDYVKEDNVVGKDPAFLNLKVKEKVRENYRGVKRWSRLTDIFEKEIIVIPVNAFQHWFCLLILNPRFLLNSSQGQAEIIYCDSMLEKRDFIVEAVRTYLQV